MSYKDNLTKENRFYIKLHCLAASNGRRSNSWKWVSVFFCKKFFRLIKVRLQFLGKILESFPSADRFHPALSRCLSIQHPARSQSPRSLAATEEAAVRRKVLKASLHIYRPVTTCAFALPQSSRNCMRQGWPVSRLRTESAQFFEHCTSNCDSAATITAQRGSPLGVTVTSGVTFLHLGSATVWHALHLQLCCTRDCGSDCVSLVRWPEGKTRVAEST